MQDSPKQNNDLLDLISNSRNKTSWVIPIIVGIFFSCVFGFIYMATQGVGIFYSVSFDEWAVKETVRTKKLLIGGLETVVEITVVDEPGIYYKGFSKIYKYPVKKSFWYEKQDDIEITFADGTRALIEVRLLVDTPKKESERIFMHQFFMQNKSTLKNEIRRDVRNCLVNSAITMTAKESLTFNRAGFVSYCKEQIINGLFGIVEVEDEDEKFVRYRYVDNPNGGYILAKTKSFMECYKIKPIDVRIISIRYDAMFQKMMDEQKIAKQHILRAEYELKLVKIESATEKLKAQTKLELELAEIDSQKAKSKALKNIPVE